MDLKQSFNTILANEVDRKQFLQQVGIAILAVFGISRILKGFGAPAANRTPAKSSGYGGKINLRNR